MFTWTAGTSLVVALSLANSPSEDGARATAPGQHATTRPGKTRQEQETDNTRAAARYRTVVGTTKSDDGLDSQRRVDAQTPGFATAIEVDHIGGATPSDAVAEVLDRSVATTTRSVGGLGQFSAVSIRGSSPQQVELLSDGIPLGDSFVGAVNLGDLSLTPLAGIEIYRGYVPIAMGASAIGGVINLVSRPPNKQRSHGKVRVRGEAGSFGTRGAHISLWHPIARRLALSVDGSYAGSSGEYRYFDDRATPQYTADDRITFRQQNGYNRGLTRLRLDHRAGPWHTFIQGYGLFKQQQIPGPAGSSPPPTGLTTGLGKLMLASTRSRLGAGGRLRWLGSLGYSGRELAVTPKLTGLVPQYERTRVFDTYLSPRLRLPVWRGGFFQLAADLRNEWIAIHNYTGIARNPAGELDRTRHRVGVGVELEQFLFNRRLRLVPAFRAEALRSRFPNSDGSDQLSAQQRLRTDIAMSPRFGARLRVAAGIDIRGSVGRYFRPPTVLELFGSRGAIVGNEELKPEQGTTLDAGLTFDRTLATTHRLYAQVAGFSRHSRDTIAMLPTGIAVRAFNLAGTRVHGLESAVVLSLWSRRAELAGNYTLMPTRNLEAAPDGSSRPLPGRPRHQLFIRASTGHRFDTRDGSRIAPRIAYTLDYLDAMYLDPSGRVAIAPRAIHGASIVVAFDERVRWALEARNLTNRITTTWDASAYDNIGAVKTPLVDYLRYPLPGLSVMMHMTFDLDVPACRRRKTCTNI